MCLETPAPTLIIFIIIAYEYHWIELMFIIIAYEYHYVHARSMHVLSNACIPWSFGERE